jgi:hypothetical protein
MAVIFAVLMACGTAKAAAGSETIAMQSRVRLLVEEAQGHAAASWQQLQAAPEDLARLASDESS